MRCKRELHAVDATATRVAKTGFFASRARVSPAIAMLWPTLARTGDRADGKW